MAVVFQHSFEGFCLDTKISKIIYCSLTWSFHQLSWWESRWLQWSRQALDCCRHESLWNTSEQYMRATKNWKDGIISYFNTKDCLGIFSIQKGKYDFLSWLINKPIQHFQHACSFLHCSRCIPQPWENSLTNTLIPPQPFENVCPKLFLLLKLVSKPNWKQLCFFFFLLFFYKNRGNRSTEIWTHRGGFSCCKCAWETQAERRNVSTLVNWVISLKVGPLIFLWCLSLFIMS